MLGKVIVASNETILCVDLVVRELSYNGFAFNFWLIQKADK